MKTGVVQLYFTFQPFRPGREREPSWPVIASGASLLATSAVAARRERCCFVEDAAMRAPPSPRRSSPRIFGVRFFSSGGRGSVRWERAPLGAGGIDCSALSHVLSLRQKRGPPGCRAPHAGSPPPRSVSSVVVFTCEVNANLTPLATFGISTSKKKKKSDSSLQVSLVFSRRFFFFRRCVLSKKARTSAHWLSTRSEKTAQLWK